MAMGEVHWVFFAKLTYLRMHNWYRGLKNVRQLTLLSLPASGYATSDLHLGSCSSHTPLVKSLRLQCLQNGHVRSSQVWLPAAAMYSYKHRSSIWSPGFTCIWYPIDRLSA